jgi:hypothetical protein
MGFDSDLSHLSKQRTIESSNKIAILYAPLIRFANPPANYRLSLSHARSIHAA